MKYMKNLLILSAIFSICSVAYAGQGCKADKKCSTAQKAACSAKKECKYSGISKEENKKQCCAAKESSIDSKKKFKC